MGRDRITGHFEISGALIKSSGRQVPVKNDQARLFEILLPGNFPGEGGRRLTFAFDPLEGFFQAVIPPKQFAAGPNDEGRGTEYSQPHR